MESNEGNLHSPENGSPRNEGKSPFGMPEKESECYRKLILVLLKLLESDFQTSDDTVLPKLFDFIKTQGNQSKSDHEVLMRILTEWLKKICESWINLREEAKVFALKVAGYVASSPTGFVRFNTNGSLSCLLSLFQDQGITRSNAIDLGYLYLIEPLLSSAEGSQLVFHSGICKDVVALALSSSSIYCLRQSTKVLALMLYKSDDATAEAIMKEITFISSSPVQQTDSADGSINAVYRQNNNIRQTSPAEDRVVNTLNTCRLIFASLMGEGYPRKKLNHLIKTCKITNWSWGFLKSGTSKRVLDAANTLVCVLNSLSWYQRKNEDGQIPYEDSNNIIDVFLNHFSVLVSQRMFYQLLDACVEYHIYLHKFGATVASGKESDSLGKQISDVPFCLHNLLFLYQSLPVLLCLKARQTPTKDILEDYVDKLFRITDSKVTRHVYCWREVICSIGENVCTLGTVILQKFTQLCPLFMKEQGILVFQALTHLLEEFIVTPEESVGARTVRKFLIEGDELMSKHPGLLSACLNCLQCFLNKFDFSWRDSLESLCLLSFLQKALDSKAVTPMITVDVLKLIDVVLKKFMPPNLALLVDTLKGSSIEDLGPQLFRLLHSVEWATRDSSLEIVKTICSLSESRFPAFQALLIENKLPELVFAIIETDHEPFVRTTAVSCLYELAKVPNVWKASLSNKNVIEKLLMILHYETEGIVRVAAAKTITALYCQRSIRSQDMKMVYDIMSHSAQNDLHWEVKIECLEFWKSVMWHTLVDQGMTDGTFPDVVFSKEEKKIVKLTPEEIATRILKSLKTLSDIGCLHVIYQTFHNEADLAVQRKSVDLIKKISQCTVKYKVKEIVDCILKKRLTDNQELGVRGSDRQSPPHLVTFDDLMDVSTNDSLPQKTDDVIDQIVAHSDMDLLKGLVNTAETPRTLPELDRVVMSDDDFMRYLMKVDVDQVLEGRERWISDTAEGILSLLDDILMFSNKTEGSSAGSDKNAVDCY